MVKHNNVKKNCKHEYTEIDYQLKIRKKKKETWYLQPQKRKSSTNHKKLPQTSKLSSREEKEKLTSNGPSNSSCNLVIDGVERKQFKTNI